MAEKSFEVPSSTGDAFARLNAATKPSVEDLKVMVCLEAGGQGYYDQLAANAPNDEVRNLLSMNAREEMGHAERVRKAIKHLSGEDFPIPSPENNPLHGLGADSNTQVTKELLQQIAQLELDGDQLYGRWADNLDNEEAAKLLRQNGKEEVNHGERLEEAVRLLEG